MLKGVSPPTTANITGGSINNTPIGNTTPSTGVFVGVSTNSNAAAGIVGEYLESIIVSASGVSLTSTVVANVTSLSLTAGDWDVTGVVVFAPNAGTLGTQFTGGLTTTSAAFGPEYSINNLIMANGINGSETLPVPVLRFSFASTTTVFLIAEAIFTVSTMKAGGILRARRMR